MELSPSVMSECDQANLLHIQWSRRRPMIDAFTGLRGLACLWVFAFHAVSRSPTMEYETIPIGWMGHGGVAAVALFNCLSGWVMVWIYGDCEFKSFRCYWSFIGRRIARLFPLYYLSLVVSINDVNCMWSTDQPCTTANWIYIVLTLLGIRSWIPYLFVQFGWNSVIWSIQAEFFFYLIFPFLLRFMRYALNMNRITPILDEHSKKNTLKRVCFLWFIVFGVSGLFLMVRIFIHDDSSKQYQTEPKFILYHTPIVRITEFILGMITCVLFIIKSSNDNHERNESKADATTALISTVQSSFKTSYFSNYQYRYFAFDLYFLCQVVFFIIIYSPLVDTHGKLVVYNNIICVGPIISLIGCIILYFSAKYRSSISSKFLSSSLLTDMGNISYAFYCLVEALPQLVLLITGVLENSGIMRLWAGIGFAAFAHFYFEMPIYKWANRKLPKCQCR